MKVKELVKTVNVAWSPPAQYPTLLAAGTAGQHLDTSFNTSASLDLYSLGLEKPGYDMELRASVPSDHRFLKVIWGFYGDNPAGIIVGGCYYGTMKIYSASKMLAGDQDCLLSSPNHHKGPVRALDFNPFQPNLLASGATESEIFIWDIVNTNTPMSPGNPSQPREDIQCLQWNKQVQHILASTFSQRCIIWDLRKNEAIIKLSDANSKVRWKALQWHPEMATQLCLASDDDQAPIIQLWDLRFASSPLKTLQHHQRGILSIAWCAQDSDLLLSCAKDNTILCWNPNSDVPGGEVLCELAQTNQWYSDVSWCPRIPGLIVGSNFDGHAVVCSLLGSSGLDSHNTSNQIVDSFPGMDPFVPAPPGSKSESAVPLAKAPKWLKKSAGASFGFGGKLTIFENQLADLNAGILPKRNVIVSQVITNPDMIKRSNELESALKTEQFLDYCQGKMNNLEDEHLKEIWNYVGAYFSEDITKKFLEILGYDISGINEKLQELVPDESVTGITAGISNLDCLQNGNIDPTTAFDVIAQQEQKRISTPVKTVNTNLKLNTSDDEDGLITQAILIGNIEAAVSLCFSSKRYADAVILAMAGGPDLLARAQYRYFSEHTGPLNSLINYLVSENWSELVKNCDINCWKETLVGIFTHTRGEECWALCDALGDRLSLSEDPELRKQAQICYICSGNLNKMIQVLETGIQDTVEVVMILKRALELQGTKSVVVDGNVASVLSQYAELLVSEGNLDAALNYIGDGQNSGIVMLRDRLYKALQYIQPGTQQAPAAVKPGQTYYNQKTQPNTYNEVGSGSYHQPHHNWNTNPVQNSWGMPQVQQTAPPQIQSVPPVQSQPMKNYGSVLQPALPPTAPPTGQSAGSTHSGSRPSSVGPSSRPKYMIDPSVKSAPSYGVYGQNQVYQGQNFGYQAQGYQQTGYNAQGYGETDGFKQNPTMMMPSLPAQSASRQESQANAAFNPESAYHPPPQASGWNDPPIAKSRMQPVLALYNKNEMSAEHAGTRKWRARHSKINVPKQQAADFQQQNPILHPLRGAQPEYNAHDENYNQEPHNPYKQPQYPPNILNPSSQFNKPTDYEPPQYQQQQHQQQHPPQQQQQHHHHHQSVQQARVAEPELPKAPIPDEHIHLKTVLEDLKGQCYEAAKNPQTKRKIEDVARKLEALYDCLREKNLSPNTLQGLHQISQMIQSGNYTNGLSIHTQLVSGPDFSRIASFMPGIKVLLQSALQLGVYLT